MAILRPFRALRPLPGRVARVASVPYDVVDTHEARALAADEPLSLLHVSRPEIDLPEGTDPHSDPVYARGLSNLGRLVREAPLILDPDECLYVYRLIMGGHAQVGVVGCAAVDDYDGDVIRRHERTRKDKEDDRTRHILTLRAQTGPVFLAYRDRPAIDALVGRAMEPPPLYDFVAADGVRHTMWRVDRPSALAEVFAAVDRSYVADGHHRAASASRARAALRDSNPAHTGREEYNSFLAVLFPASQLVILPYHRVVRDLAGRPAAAFLEALPARVGVRPDAGPRPAGAGGVSMYLCGRWYSLTLAPAAAGAGPAARLDVTLLQGQVLGPLLGVADPRTDPRIGFVGGIRPTAELERRVDSGEWAVAFSMAPVTMDDLMAIADRGELMPPKSTWFEPKLRSGLVIHAVEGWAVDQAPGGA